MRRFFFWGVVCKALRISSVSITLFFFIFCSQFSESKQFLNFNILLKKKSQSTMFKFITISWKSWLQSFTIVLLL